MKKLIVNADDLGYSKGINRGIIESHEKGIVTSTSLMVNGLAAEEGVRLVKRYPNLGVGLHFVLTNEDWKALRMMKKAVGVALAKKVGDQLQVQLEKFQNLVGRMPDHINAHHHVHKLPRIYPYFERVSQEYKIPLRDVGRVEFIDTFFGMDEITGVAKLEKVNVDSLLKILDALPDGISELMCHPGYVTPDLKSSYNRHREIELKTLTDPRIKDFIQRKGIKLINFSQI